MLYIHKLSDLNPKVADIESVPFVRQFKQLFPFEAAGFSGLYAEAAISSEDALPISRALQLIAPLKARLSALLASNDPLYEPVAIQRTIQGLNSLVLPLANNLQHINEVLAVHGQFYSEAASLLNSIPRLKNAEEKSAANSRLSFFFEKILRSKGISFAFQDIVYEAQTGTVSGLASSFRNGYLFHVTLEEEIRKANFDEIKPRIPPAALKEASEIEQSILEIKQGVDKAYDINMRMILWAVIFYSMIKVATSR